MKHLRMLVSIGMKALRRFFIGERVPVVSIFITSVSDRDRIFHTWTFYRKLTSRASITAENIQCICMRSLQLADSAEVKISFHSVGSAGESLFAVLRDLESQDCKAWRIESVMPFGFL